MKTQTAIIAMVGALTLATHAQAAQITLGNSTAGTFDFTGVPPSSLTVASPGIVGAGTAFFPPGSGDYTFQAVAPFPAGPLVGGNFPTAGTQTLNVSMADGDLLVASIDWGLLKDHSTHPDLDGLALITDSQGDAAWLASFPVGGLADNDLALTIYPGPFLDEIAATGDKQWATISSGEFVPRAAPVPEPNTLAILGAALVGMFLWSRRRLA